MAAILPRTFCRPGTALRTVSAVGSRTGESAVTAAKFPLRGGLFGSALRAGTTVYPRPEDNTANTTTPPSPTRLRRPQSSSAANLPPAQDRPSAPAPTDPIRRKRFPTPGRREGAPPRQIAGKLATSPGLFVSLAAPKILRLGITKLSLASALGLFVSLAAPKILRLGITKLSLASALDFSYL